MLVWSHVRTKNPIPSRIKGGAGFRIKSGDKQFRAIATRYDKTARNFLAAVHLTAAVIWLN